MINSEKKRLSIVWASILLITLFTAVLQSFRADEESEVLEDGGVEVVDAPAPEPQFVARVEMPSELVGKLVIALDGLRSMAPSITPQQILESAKPLSEPTAPLADQLGYSVLVGRVSGWTLGADHARVIETKSDAGTKLRDEVVAAMESLAATSAAASTGDAKDDASDGATDGATDDATDGATDDATVGATNDAPSQAIEPMSAQRMHTIEESLGFFGRALGTGADEEAARTVVIIVLVAAWYFVVFFSGLVALLILAIGLARGKITPRIELATQPHIAIVLGETFAIWMALFLGLTIGAMIVGDLVSAFILPEGTQLPVAARLGLSIAATFASLMVLAYPRLRGVSFAQLRQAIGLHTGQGWLREGLHGIVCYVSAIPFLAAGLVVFMLLTLLSESLVGKQPQPSHPMVELLGGVSGIEVVMLLLLASVAAPIVEETAFRGLLYGHLRAVVAPRIRLVSALVAAVSSSFIFAIIHPQGALFVPALGGLAVGFCIYREVRGSLIAPMVAHGINNAVTLTIGLTLLS